MFHLVDPRRNAAKEDRHFPQKVLLYNCDVCESLLFEKQLFEHACVKPSASYYGAMRRPVEFNFARIPKRKTSDF